MSCSKFTKEVLRSGQVCQLNARNERISCFKKKNVCLEGTSGVFFTSLFESYTERGEGKKLVEEERLT